MAIFTPVLPRLDDVSNRYPQGGVFVLRFVFSALPGSGHIHPMIPGAQALIARGHEVTFATSPALVGYLRKIGFDAIGVGPDWVEGGDDSISTRLISLDVPGQLRLFVEIASMGAVKDLLDFFSKWRPAAVVSEDYDYAGRLAAELADIPAAPHSVTVRLPRGMSRPIIGPDLDRLRTSLGLDPDPELGRVYGRLYLDFVPLSLALPEARQLPLAIASDQLSSIQAVAKAYPLARRTAGPTHHLRNSGDRFQRYARRTGGGHRSDGRRAGHDDRNYRPEPRPGRAGAAASERPRRAIHTPEWSLPQVFSCNHTRRFQYSGGGA